MCDQETCIENTSTVPEVVGLSSEDIDQQINTAFNQSTNKRKRSASTSSSSSSSSDSSSNSSTSSSSNSTCSSKNSGERKRAKPDSSSSSASNSPKFVGKKRLPVSSPSSASNSPKIDDKKGKSGSSGSEIEDFGPGFKRQLDALADSFISSTTGEAKLIEHTAPKIDPPGAPIVSKAVHLGSTSIQPAIEELPETELASNPSKLAPSGKLVSIRHHLPNRDPRLFGRVTSQSRLPKELLDRITPIAPSRPSYSTIRERVEQNISDSLGKPFRLPRIEFPAPRAPSPTFARFNPGLVYLPPRPEPIPNITINNNYYGGNFRGHNRGHFRGGHRDRGTINREPRQPQSQEEPFQVLSKTEIDLLSRGQKRRYFKRLAAHQ